MEEPVRWAEERQEKGADYFKVRSIVFDTATQRAINELIDRKIIWRLGRVISAGKEALVFHAITLNGEERAVKIYKSLTASFKKRDIYFKTYRDRLRKSKIVRTIEWAKKEYKAILMAYQYVRTPKPHALRRNVLVMEFIGHNGIPAPLVKDIKIENPTETGTTVMRWIVKLFRKGGLIHADLSEFNILYFNKEPVLIDWGQAVLSTHPRADFLLLRDLVRVADYFSRIGGDVPDPIDLFVEATGEKPSYLILTELGLTEKL